MKFSIYSELQWWPGKEPKQVYDEVLEQIVNAERVGFDTYSAIEHFFFPKFSASPDPIALFSAAAQRTSRIGFRTLVHVLPYHNPMVLASRIAFADILMGGRYEFGVGRGHGWIPWRAGVSYGEMVERYDESLDILFTALESAGEPFSYEGKFFDVHDARIVPPPRTEVPRVHRRHLRQDVHLSPRRRAGASPSRRSSRTRRCASSSTCTARSATSSAPSPTSSGSTPATSTRTATRPRGRPRPGSRASSPATRRRWWSTRSPGRRAAAAGYGFYTAGSSRSSPRRRTTR